MGISNPSLYSQEFQTDTNSFMTIQKTVSYITHFFNFSTLQGHSFSTVAMSALNSKSKSGGQSPKDTLEEQNSSPVAPFRQRNIGGISFRGLT